MWTIQLPLRVPVSKKKFFPLNLNQYRNAHFQVLDKAKKAFAKEIEPKLVGIPKLKKLALEYVLYPGTSQLCDTNNILSIADKFFSDSLVAQKVIDDDNYTFIADSRFLFGHIDRENPRIEVTIRSPDHIPLVRPEPLTEESERETMKIVTLITLTQMDLNAALGDYVGKLVPTTPDMNFDLQKQADGTYQIKLEVASGAVSPVPVAPVEPPKHRGRAPKAEPKVAMAALKEAHATAAQTSQAAPENAPEASQAASTATANAVSPEEVAAANEKLAAEKPEATAEAQQPAPAKSIFAKAKEATQAKTTEEPKPEQTATPVSEPDFEAEPEAENQGEETPPPAAPKGPSLFAGFKRPNNAQ